MSPISSRRSIRLPKLVRLPSKSGESTTSYSDGSSCPNSPAVKKTYRLVVVGSARSGKSAIVNRFLDIKDFEDRYLPTIENFHRKLYKLRGEIYQLDILDRSGNDPFPAARKLSYITGDIFILVSSVDHAQSVAQMLEIYAQIVECKSGRMSRQLSNGSFHHKSSSSNMPPVVFVLNKTDLPAHKWQVSMEEVEELVSKTVNGRENCFVSCSALHNENVSKAFSKVFTLGKLPKYMNPETHKLLRSELSADRVQLNSTCNATAAASGNVVVPVVGKRPVLQRMRSKFSKDNDDEIIIDVNARRPSLRTDLLLNRAKCVVPSNGQSSPKIYDPTAGVPLNNKHCIIS